MKKSRTRFLLPIALSVLFFNSSLDAQAQGWLDQASKGLKNLTGSKNEGFSEADAAQALKEALTQGTLQGADVLSAKDGFFANPEVKIPFPVEAQKMEITLRKMGLGSKVDDAVLSINRAAELATSETKSVFQNAIANMSIVDAINIVKGTNHSATDYLSRATRAELYEKCKPIVASALEKVDATKYWKSVVSTYNAVPFTERVNPDLTDYTTNKTLDALFVMIAQQEEAIRRDPVARTTELLKKVFGR